MAHSPPGHHSVMGQPRVGGLNYPEYVIYRGEQVSSFFYNFQIFIMSWKIRESSIRYLKII